MSAYYCPKCGRAWPRPLSALRCCEDKEWGGLIAAEHDAEIRRAALEEAAVHLETKWTDPAEDCDQADAIRECARVVRALASPPVPEKPE